MNSPLARAQNTILVWQKKCDAKDLEIERLQSLLEAANEMEADREAALQEIERLRSALEQIDEYHKAGGTQVITCARIAREATRDAACKKNPQNNVFFDMKHE